MRTEPTVFIVDDDLAVRESLRRLMESVGLRVELYSAAQEFLDTYQKEWPGCLILDINMPGMSGLELQELLIHEGIGLPVIIVSAHGNIERVVRAMKAGAVDFVRKPYTGEVLMEHVWEALERDARERRDEAERAEMVRRLEALTPREREVMARLVAGRSAKEVAYELKVSRKTIDVHRSHIMSKLEIDSVVELVRMAEKAQFGV